MPQAYTSPLRTLVVPTSPHATMKSPRPSPTSSRPRNSRKRPVPTLSPKEVAEYIMDQNVASSPILARMVLEQQVDGRALAAIAPESDTEDSVASISNVLRDERLAQDFLTACYPLLSKLPRPEAVARNRPSLQEIATALSRSNSLPSTSAPPETTPLLTPTLSDWSFDEELNGEDYEEFAPEQTPDGGEDDDDDVFLLSARSPSSYHSAVSPRARITTLLQHDVPHDVMLLSALEMPNPQRWSPASHVVHAGEGDQPVHDTQADVLSRHHETSIGPNEDDAELDLSPRGRTSSSLAQTKSALGDNAPLRRRAPRRASCPPRPHLGEAPVLESFVTHVREPQPLRRFAEAEIQTEVQEETPHKRPEVQSSAEGLPDLTSGLEDTTGADRAESSQTQPVLATDTATLSESPSQNAAPPADQHPPAAPPASSPEAPTNVQPRTRTPRQSPSFICLDIKRTESEPKRARSGAQRPSAAARTQSYAHNRTSSEGRNASTKGTRGRAPPPAPPPPPPPPAPPSKNSRGSGRQVWGRGRGSGSGPPSTSRKNNAAKNPTEDSEPGREQPQTPADPSAGTEPAPEVPHQSINGGASTQPTVEVAATKVKKDVQADAPDTKEPEATTAASSSSPPPAPKASQQSTDGAGSTRPTAEAEATKAKEDVHIDAPDTKEPEATTAASPPPPPPASESADQTPPQPESSQTQTTETSAETAETTSTDTQPSSTSPAVDTTAPETTASTTSDDARNPTVPTTQAEAEEEEKTQQGQLADALSSSILDLPAISTSASASGTAEVDWSTSQTDVLPTITVIPPNPDVEAALVSSILDLPATVAAGSGPGGPRPSASQSDNVPLITAFLPAADAASNPDPVSQSTSTPSPIPDAEGEAEDEGFTEVSGADADAGAATAAGETEKENTEPWLEISTEEVREAVTKAATGDETVAKPAEANEEATKTAEGDGAATKPAEGNKAPTQTVDAGETVQLPETTPAPTPSQEKSEETALGAQGASTPVSSGPVSRQISQQEQQDDDADTNADAESEAASKELSKMTSAGKKKFKREAKKDRLKQEKEERERQAKQEQERQEQERQERAEARKREREQAEAKKREQDELKKKREAAAKARKVEEAQQKQREAQERKAKEEREGKEKEEREREAKEEQTRQEKAAQAQREEERKRTEQQEQERIKEQESLRKLLEEDERKQREQEAAAEQQQHEVMRRNQAELIRRNQETERRQAEAARQSDAQIAQTRANDRTHRANSLTRPPPPTMPDLERQTQAQKGKQSPPKSKGWWLPF